MIDCGKCLWSSLCVVCHWHCFYDVIITIGLSVVCLSPISSSYTSSPDARPGTWLGNYASSLWVLWGEGMLIISMSELLEITVWIIENEKVYSISAKKSELLETLNYWSRYGRRTVCCCMILRALEARNFHSCDLYVFYVFQSTHFYFSLSHKCYTLEFIITFGWTAEAHPVIAVLKGSTRPSKVEPSTLRLVDFNSQHHTMCEINCLFM